METQPPRAGNSLCVHPLLPLSFSHLSKYTFHFNRLSHLSHSCAVLCLCPWIPSPDETVNLLQLLWDEVGQGPRAWCLLSLPNNSFISRNTWIHCTDHFFLVLFMVWNDFIYLYFLLLKSLYSGVYSLWGPGHCLVHRYSPAFHSPWSRVGTEISI